jgi:putative Holliday junction resolvase
MRILGIDYGDKRIGLAVTDEAGFMAHALKVVPNKTAFNEIKNVILEYDIKKIVIGMPYNLKGETAFKAKQVIEWIGRFKNETTVPIETFDERFTTYDANEVLIQSGASRKKRKEIIDKAAAQFMLENYLSAKKERNE